MRISCPPVRQSVSQTLVEKGGKKRRGLKNSRTAANNWCRHSHVLRDWEDPATAGFAQWRLDIKSEVVENV
jgi:hypothetical protein